MVCLSSIAVILLVVRKVFKEINRVRERKVLMTNKLHSSNQGDG